MLNNKKIVAFICECNPFHKGHKRLINSALKEGDIVIAIMSGNFVQRGEPAIYNKYKRCRDLLKNGVSMVIEIPIEYSLSSAKYFATYSVSVLNKLGFVDKLIFGSKINDISELSRLAEIKGTEINISDTRNSNIIHKYLKEGYTYSYAMSKLLGKNLSSNDILAIEYISALKSLKSKIMPICIKRNNDIPTASELRKSIVPKITNDDFSPILNYKLQLAKNGLYDLSDTYLMTNDLNNAIIKTADKNLSFTKRAKLLKTKNRTLANIKRVLLNIVLGINKSDVNNIKINYIRILGIKKDFVDTLKYIKVPYLLSYNNTAYKTFIKKFPKSNAIKLNKNGEFKLSPYILLNVFASDLYNLFSSNKHNEATTKTIIL